MTTNEIKDLILKNPKILGEFLFDHISSRRILEQHGITVAPSNFYSNIPSITDIENSFEYREPSPPYDLSEVFDAQIMRQELEELIKFAEPFNPPLDGDEQNPSGYFFNNRSFSHSDAMSLFAYITKLKPSKIFEIGSGFSSLITLEALKHNGTGKLQCVEPYPPEFIKSLAELGFLDLTTKPAQEISFDDLDDQLEDGDILFVDTTHTVKSGSECLHIYLRLLPLIRKKLYIHIHDIFLPFGYPREWLLDRQVYWTEQYLVLAWIMDNPRVKVLYGSAYHQHHNIDLLDKLSFGRHPNLGGGSLWLEYN